ncbi:MAG TPA: hypothetical protein VFA20_11360 [Myxococcaceae bacterium]|nr:hypothetical protein [Myxococcaceae bacterium]
MKRWQMNVVAAVMALGMASPALAGELQRREVRQQERIAQGVQSGQLTARETARLERREAHAQNVIARDRVDGGGLTAREAAKDNRMLNRTSRAIYRQKHDAQRR